MDSARQSADASHRSLSGGGVEHLSHLNFLRVVHENNPVPMLPPVFVELGEIGIYHHSGSELLIRPDGRTTHLKRHLDNRLDVRSY